MDDEYFWELNQENLQIFFFAKSFYNHLHIFTRTLNEIISFNEQILLNLREMFSKSGNFVYSW